MIIPVKCFTCGKVLADKWLYYQTKVRQIKNYSVLIESKNNFLPTANQPQYKNTNTKMFQWKFSC